MAICGICLEDTPGTDRYHEACIQELFGTQTVPDLGDIELSTLYRLAAEMAGKMSISGVQEKVSLALSVDKASLQIAANGGRYILKPEPAMYSSLPPNEHVTMLLARLAEIDTPPFGLMWLKDQTPAYIIKRFDRLDDGSKLAVEDFCQLSGSRLRDKYKGSGEKCVRLLKQFASEPIIEVRRLFKLLLFSWWVSNGDHHLKNLSIMTDKDGRRRLAPAYDLVSTRLVNPKDLDLAIPINGQKQKLTRGKWLAFAEYCGLEKKASMRLLADQVECLVPATRLINRSFLPDKKKQQYVEILNVNTNILAAQ
jgi:serine/threonine-protein kinase HipA